MRYPPEHLRQQVLARFAKSELHTSEELDDFLEGLGVSWAESELLILRQLEETIKRFLSPSEAEVMESLYYMTAPCGTANALILRYRGGETIVALNLGLLRNATLFTSWLYCAHGFREREEVDSLLDAIFALARIAAASISHQPIVSVPAAAGISDDATEMIAGVTQMIWLLVFCHELGHLACGHLESGSWRPLSPGICPEPDVEYLHKSQLQEFEADSYAAKVLRRWPGAEEFLGISLATLFTFMELIEFADKWTKALLARDRKVFHAAQQLSHPAARARADRLMKEMKSMEYWVRINRKTTDLAKGCYGKMLDLEMKGQRA